MFFAQKYLPIWNLKKKNFNKLIITLKIHKSVSILFLYCLKKSTAFNWKEKGNFFKVL